jgi:hypothetical protein
MESGCQIHAKPRPRIAEHYLLLAHNQKGKLRRGCLSQVCACGAVAEKQLFPSIRPQRSRREQAFERNTEEKFGFEPYV